VGGPATVAQVHTLPRNFLTEPGSTGIRLNLSSTPSPSYSIKKEEGEDDEGEKND
jgi:hypothetical protein